MKIEYELSKDDLKKSLNQYLFYFFKRGIISYSIFAIVFGYAFSVNENKEIDWANFLIYSSIFFVILNMILFGIPAIISIYKIRNKKSKMFYSVSDDKIISENIESKKQIENSLNQTKRTIQIKDYFLVVFKKNYIPIPLSLLTEENKNALKSKVPIQNKTGIPNLVYFLTIIPNIGFLAGIIFLIIGVKNKVKKSILWGLFGILFTPLFWFVSILILENTDASKKRNINMTKHQLNEIVKDLTYYKTKNKFFPDSLGQLKKQNEFFNDTDFSTTNPFFRKKSKPQKFYYKKLNDSTYVLKSKGMDGILNTKDDINPDL